MLSVAVSALNLILTFKIKILFMVVIFVFNEEQKVLNLKDHLL